MAKIKYDGILEAVHLDADGQVEIARIYEKRGAVFSDRFLVSRDELIKRINKGQKFLLGTRIPKTGSVFNTSEPVRVVSVDGKENLQVGEGDAKGDLLTNVPRF